MNEYEINLSTLLLIPYNKNTTHIYEKDIDFSVKMKSIKIIDKSCKFFGSSLSGRQDGAKDILGSGVKVPIVIEDSRNIIFFPTSSPRVDDCIWISYNNLLKYVKNGDSLTRLFFIDGREFDVNVSYNIIDNQVTRCIKLEKLLINRKKEF